jgi:hypothetical protein
MLVKMNDKHRKSLKKLEKVRRKKTALEEVERKLQLKVESIEKDISQAEKWVKEPRHIRVLKVIAVLLAVGLIGYLITVNFLISQDFNYFYDIGGSEDAKNPYLAPGDRVSDVLTEGEIHYRSFDKGIIYLDAGIPRGFEYLLLSIKFKSSFPENYSFFVGVRNLEEWGYDFREIDSQPKKFNESSWVSSSEIKFYKSADNLYFANGKLNVALRAPHLWEGYPDKVVYIDWINLTMHKPGLFEKMGWQDDIDRFFERIKLWWIEGIKK